MFSLTLVCSSSQRDDLLGELYDCGTAGIVEEEAPGAGLRLRAFFSDDSARESLAARFAAYGAVCREEEDKDWTAGWRDSWPPILVGSKFYVVPVWNPQPAPEGRWRLEVDPGMAFGTGLHPTTQLCLEALERHLRPAETVLDLGAGSGILARGAALAGAGRIYACDIDADAAAVARRALEGRAHVFAGSLRSLRPNLVDLMLANINAETLVSLAGAIASVLRPGGRVILSGFLSRQQERVHGRFTEVGLDLLGAREKQGWAAMVWSRPEVKR